MQGSFIPIILDSERSEETVGTSLNIFRLM